MNRKSQWSVKRKRSGKRNIVGSGLIQRLGRSRLIRVLVTIELLALVGAVYYCLIILSFPFGTPGYLVTPTPVEETVKVPLNSRDVVFTQHKYSDWVSISISGSGKRYGEVIHDAFYNYNVATQEPRSEFDGFLIDGVPASHGQGQPDYRYNHTYRFSHYVYRFQDPAASKMPKAIEFQVISEPAEGMDGVFTIEISSDSFKHKPEARGR